MAVSSLLGTIFLAAASAASWSASAFKGAGRRWARASSSGCSGAMCRAIVDGRAVCTHHLSENRVPHGRVLVLAAVEAEKGGCPGRVVLVNGMSSLLADVLAMLLRECGD